MSIVYLNGEFLPVEQAKVSVMDRGFLFGDGVYEVIPVYNSKLINLPKHFKRLHNSLAGIHMKIALSDEELTQIISQLVKKNDHKNMAIYLQITRGAPETRQHYFDDSCKPTVFIRTSPIGEFDIEQLAQGKKAITAEDIRWKFCHLKTVALLGNVLLRQHAQSKGAQEAILIKEGYAIEGSTSNLFIVKNGVVITPPMSNDILGGITREVTLQLLESQSEIPFEVRAIKVSELLEADEVWITSSTRAIMPITELDGKPVANGEVGPIWRKLITQYQNYIHSL